MCSISPGKGFAQQGCVSDPNHSTLTVLSSYVSAYIDHLMEGYHYILLVLKDKAVRAEKG